MEFGRPGSRHIRLTAPIIALLQGCPEIDELARSIGAEGPTRVLGCNGNCQVFGLHWGVTNRRSRHKKYNPSQPWGCKGVGCLL